VEQSSGRELNEEHRRAVEVALEYFRTAAPRHTADEEESLFPLLRASGEPDAREAMRIVQTLEEEHSAANVAHAEVESLYQQWIRVGQLPAPETRKLSQTLHELREVYRRHIEVEDREIFPLAGKLLNREQLAQIGKEMARRRGLREPG
jgi:hemerythrin-like domain-containing protein